MHPIIGNEVLDNMGSLGFLFVGLELAQVRMGYDSVLAAGS